MLQPEGHETTAVADAPWIGEQARRVAGDTLAASRAMRADAFAAPRAVAVLLTAAIDVMKREAQGDAAAMLLMAVNAANALVGLAEDAAARAGGEVVGHA